MPAHRFTGCSRGVFGLNNWDSLRKPGETVRSTSKADAGSPVTKPQPWAQSPQNRMPRVSPGRGHDTSGADYMHSHPTGDWSRDNSKSGRQSHFKHDAEHSNVVKADPLSSIQRWGDVQQPSKPPAGSGGLQVTASADTGSGQSLTGGPKPGNRLMAKYSYKANGDSPLGEELQLAQGDKLTFVGFHDCHWWLAQNDDGRQGFVPAQYMMVLEDKPSSLPWLQTSTREEQAPPAAKNSKFGLPPQGTWKPYASAYQNKEPEKKYVCDICEKTFNGPQPYHAHMKSRGHREEVENQELYRS